MARSLKKTGPKPTLKGRHPNTEHHGATLAHSLGSVTAHLGVSTPHLRRQKKKGR